MLQSFDLFELITIFLPLIIVLGLTLIVWLVGRSINNRMFRKIDSELERVVKGKIIDEFDVQGAAPASKSITGTPRLNDLKTFKMLISLEERHLLITFLFSLFSKPQDYILFESDLPQRPSVAIEIIPWKEKRLIQKNSKHLTAMELLEFKNEKFDSAIMVRANRRGPAFEVLGDKELFKALYQARNYLYWVSVDPKETPHLKVMVRWQKGVNIDKMAEIFLTLARQINISDYDKKMKSYGGKKKKE